MKKLYTAAAVVGAVLVVAGVVGLASIDRVIKKAIEAGSSYAMGVETDVAEADIGLLSGELAVRGLRIDNPEGFDGDHFVALNRGDVAVTLGSLRRDVIELGRLTFWGLDMNLQRVGWRSNYGVILGNLQRFESDQQTQPQETTSSGKQLVIREVEVRDVVVHVDLLPEGGDLTRVNVPIDRIHLTDIGAGGNGGVAVAELSAVLVKAVIAAAIDKGGDLIPADIGQELTQGLARLKDLEGLGVQLIDDIEQQAGEHVGRAVEQARGVVEKAKQDVQQVGQEAQQALEGFKGLLGSDRDKQE